VWGEGKVAVYQMGVGTTNEKPFAIGKCLSLIFDFHCEIILFERYRKF
jgi:hypothetical protein